MAGFMHIPLYMKCIFSMFKIWSSGQIWSFGSVIWFLFIWLSGFGFTDPPQLGSIMLSINQLQAQIKLMEMWNAKYNNNYPLKIDTQKQTESGITTRGVTNSNFKHINTPHTCIGDATKLWNEAPEGIKKASSINIAKSETKKYCKTLPI